MCVTATEESRTNTAVKKKVEKKNSINWNCYVHRTGCYSFDGCQRKRELHKPRSHSIGNKVRVNTTNKQGTHSMFPQRGVTKRLKQIQL